MPIVTYTSHDGAVTSVEAGIGQSVMQAAVQHGVRGILGECGGVLSCATCHVFVDEADMSRVGPPGDMENELLDGAATDRTPRSRLACQIKMREDLDGLRVELPEHQE